MAKNILVFSDGTGQDGGVRPDQVLSNIYKLYRVCRVGPASAIDPKDQIAFYDPGLGTDTTATGWTRIVRGFQKLLSSVTGRGIAINIADCYEFIINHYEPGDRIYLFGFSRGAYTVRSVANLLMLCGVPTNVSGQPPPKFRKATRNIAEDAVYTVLEHGAGHPRELYEAERLELARRFCVKYGSLYPEPTDEHRSNAAPYFIGVFDTVAALGVKGTLRLAYQAFLYSISAVIGAAISLVIAVPATLLSGSWMTFFWLTFAGAVVGGAVMRFLQRRGIRKVITNYPSPGQSSSHCAEWKGEHFDRLLSRHVTYARAANAIDEHREDFARLPWGQGKDINVPDEIDGRDRLKQVWFAGNHSDIGGSYPDTESRLSDITLCWMIEEVLSLPASFKIGPVFVNGKKVPATGDEGESLRLYPDAEGLQHCEVVGMRDVVEGKTPRWLHWATKSLGYKVKPRVVHANASLHRTVYERLGVATVPQCSSSVGAYRPEELRQHVKCQSYYSSAPAETEPLKA